MNEEEINVQRSLGRIEGKLDSLVYSVNTHMSSDSVTFAAHEKKLDKQQEDITAMKTKAALLGTLAGAGTTVFVQLAAKYFIK